MKVQKVATAAIVLALPLGAAVAPAAASGKSHAKPRPRTHLRGHRTASTVTFRAQVVRAGAKGLVLRRSDGRTVEFSTEQIMRSSIAAHRKHPHHRRHGLMEVAQSSSVSTGNVVVNILGLQPGVTVVVTESIDGNGSVTVTITLPAAPVGASASGVVTELDSDAFTIQTSDGSELRLHMAADALAGLNLQTCDTVDVTYHQDAGILVADDASQTGSSTADDCAPTQELSGAVSQVSDSSVTVDPGSGPVTINVDPTSGLTDGYQVGDLIAVTYTENPDGSLNATDIHFVEEDATGQVTSVTTSNTGGSLTITDDDTGASDVFATDPNNGVQINARAFNGVSVGDGVDISYHESAGQLIADTVSEQ